MRVLPHDAADEVLVPPPSLAGGEDPRCITAALNQACGVATSTSRSPHTST
ncbi:hypothetical protein ABZ848_27835 [Streptomyces sp. NPDC047081]|uniref:hypothetical protein n=1 Tax=Streptomyces sp. NPDC047081 TaxID=3154706 RepID=UPI0033E75BA7